MTESTRPLIDVPRSGPRGHGKAKAVEITRQGMEGGSRSLSGEQHAEEGSQTKALEEHGFLG